MAHHISGIKSNLACKVWAQINLNTKWPLMPLWQHVGLWEDSGHTLLSASCREAAFLGANTGESPSARREPGSPLGVQQKSLCSKLWFHPFVLTRAFIKIAPSNCGIIWKLTCHEIFMMWCSNLLPHYEPLYLRRYITYINMMPEVIAKPSSPLCLLFLFFVVRTDLLRHQVQKETVTWRKSVKLSAT